MLSVNAVRGLLWVAVVVAVFVPTTVEAGEDPVVFPAEQWQRKAPEELGVDSEKLKQLSDQVGGVVCVIKDGSLIYTWGPQERRGDWLSAAKPVMSTMLFFAVEEGRLDSVHARLADWDWDLREEDQSMTFYHLANMTSGYAISDNPGEHFAYNDYAIRLYARTLERVFDETLVEAARKRIAERLGFEDGPVFSPGVRGDHGVDATCRDFARLGWLWLNHGNWAGEQVIPASYFQEFMKLHVTEDMPVSQDKRKRDYLGVGSYGGGVNQSKIGPGIYGFNWWFNTETERGRPWPDAPPDTFQANGGWGNHAMTMIPSLNMVCASHGRWGRFSPGDADSKMNRMLELLVSACEAEADSGAPD